MSEAKIVYTLMWEYVGEIIVIVDCLQAATSVHHFRQMNCFSCFIGIDKDMILVID